MPSDPPETPASAAPVPIPERLDLDRYVPFGLTAIANKIARSASRVYLRRFGVGINEWRILANLRITPGVTANLICQMSGLDKAAVSRSLRLLEDGGMIETCGESSDVRGRALRLTAKGDQLHDGLIGVALKREAMLLDGFDEAERRQLLSFIARLHANVALVNDGTDSAPDPG
jgi:DNA-binding MarR family transcriptional regulator